LPWHLAAAAAGLIKAGETFDVFASEDNFYLPAGTVLGYTTYVTAGLVNSRTATLPATKNPSGRTPGAVR
jgi:hypothetical protein